MDDDTLPQRFEALVSVDLTIPDGYTKHYVELPDAVARAFAAAGARRVEGRIDGVGFRRRAAAVVADLRSEFGLD